MLESTTSQTVSKKNPPKKVRPFNLENQRLLLYLLSLSDLRERSSRLSEFVDFNAYLASEKTDFLANAIKIV